MEFKTALREPNAAERRARIEEEIYNEGWEEHLSDHMRRGGLPDDVIVDSIDIDEDDLEGPVVATVSLGFVEVIATGCADVNIPRRMMATLSISIDRETGTCDIEDTSVNCLDDEAMHEGDIY